MRAKIITFLYSLLFYLAVLMIPFEKIVDDSLIILILQICAKLILLIYLYFDIFHKKNIAYKNEFSLLFIPLFIGALSNYLTIPFCNGSIDINITPLQILQIPNTFILVCIEEIIFRHLAFDLFNHVIKESKNKDLYVILIASALFASIHFINIFSSGFTIILSQVGYTFLLGFILGVIKVKSKSLIYPILGHLLFNLFNDVIFVMLFKIEYNVTYYIVSAVIGIILVIYSLFILIKEQKNKDTIRAF